MNCFSFLRFSYHLLLEDIKLPNLSYISPYKYSDSNSLQLSILILILEKFLFLISSFNLLSNLEKLTIKSHS